jgi:hypothetical protein
MSNWSLRRMTEPWLLVLVIAILSGCSSPQSTSSSDSSEASGAEFPLQFTDVTTRAGLDEFRHVTGGFGQKWNPEWMGGGAGFIDYNDDGWVDILLVGGGVFSESDREEAQALWLYRNNGDGTFTEQTAEAGLADVSAYALGITVADYDNDGDQDFFLTNLHENMLFRNDGEVFTEVGEDAGLSRESAWSSAAIFFDADRDGWLDLYVGNYVDWSPEGDIWCSLTGEEKAYCTPQVYDGLPGRFYRNNGDGTFSDRTEQAGFLPSPGKTLGVTSFDYNKDGWPDLVVANDTERNLLYTNNGDGTFEETGTRSGVAFDPNGKARAGMGIDAGITDTTGEYSVFIGNFSKEMIGVFRHSNDGLFFDRASASQIGLPSRPILTFGLFLFDVDLDTDLDLFVANGHMQPDITKVHDGIRYREPAQLFRNNFDGTFEEVGQQIGGVFDSLLVARGAAYADYDRDGDLDVLLTENDSPAHLWRNDLQNDHHYLRVHLQGTESNRDGIGSQIEAVVGDRRMIRRVRTGSSYLSQMEKTITFGLAEATTVDSLIVRWPSGRVNRFQEIPADQELFIEEGSDAYETLDPRGATVVTR